MTLKLFEADKGATVRATGTIKVEDVLANPATVTVKVLAPGGTITTVTPTNASTGVYYYDISLTASGEWVVRFESTGNEGAQELRFVCRRTYF